MSWQTLCNDSTLALALESNITYYVPKNGSSKRIVKLTATFTFNAIYATLDLGARSV